MTRVAVLGLDSADRGLVERLLGEGRLPHLAALRARGAWCRLRQPLPLSERPWDTLLTGREGRLAATTFDPATYGTAAVWAPPHPPFYARVPGLHPVVLDVPYMPVAAGPDCVQVVGWSDHYATAPRVSRPRGLLAEIEARFGRHPALALSHRLWWGDPGYLRDLAAALAAGAARRVDLAQWLLGRAPAWRLFLGVTTEAHSAGEAMWQGVEPHPAADAAAAAVARARLLEVYEALDAAAGRFAAGLPQDAVLVVCSLHGTRRNDADVPASALLPELLCRLYAGRRLMRQPDPAAWRRRGCPPVRLGPREDWGAYMLDRFPARGARDWLAARARTYAPALLRARRALLERAGRPGGRPHALEADGDPEALTARPLPIDGPPPCRYRALWPAMRAFALPTAAGGRVRINLRGRERDGIVAPEDYAAACDEVERALRACRNPRTGRPVVADVARPRAGDPLDPEGPSADLVVEFTDCPDALEHPEAGVVGPVPYRRTGAHTPDGFAVVAGPGVGPGDLGERPALDLVPTLLALLGREAPADLPGRPFLGPVSG